MRVDGGVVGEEASDAALEESVTVLSAPEDGGEETSEAAESLVTVDEAAETGASPDERRAIACLTIAIGGAETGKGRAPSIEIARVRTSR